VHTGAGINMPVGDQLSSTIADYVNVTFEDAGAKLVPLMEGLAARLPGIALDFVPRVLVGDLPLTLNELIGQARIFALRVEGGSEPLAAFAPPAPVLNKLTTSLPRRRESGFSRLHAYSLHLSALNGNSFNSALASRHAG
jgi:hypothetical protein